MNREVMFSSNSDEWSTPDAVFEELNNEFNFDLDAAANDENHKCDRYFTKEQDGLKQNWGVTKFLSIHHTVKYLNG